MSNPSSEPRYPFVHVDVPADLADEVSALLFELGATGVEERDATTLAKNAGPDTVTLVASFDTREVAEEACEAFDESFAPRIEEVVGDAWRDAWKEHFHPFALTDRITVRPPWEAYPAKREGEMVLELEPGRAFGTGLHATTSLVSKALDARGEELRSREILDVGTGSGILALVALLLGAEKARGIDVDADAIEVAKENAERNGLADRFVADTTPVEDIEARYPVVLANIEARVLIPLADAIKKAVAPGGLLVLSGILVGQEDDVAKAYAPFTVEEMPTEGEWVALVLRAGA